MNHMNLLTPITFKQFCVKSRMWRTYCYHVSRGSARFWAFVVPHMGDWIWHLFSYLRDLRRLYEDVTCDSADIAAVDKTFAYACERFSKKVVF